LVTTILSRFIHRRNGPTKRHVTPSVIAIELNP
jgi:hypothetical protein